MVLLSASMGKGGVCASARIRMLSALTSISPVFKFSLVAPERFVTVPTTAMTYSLLSLSAFAKFSAPQSLSSKIICKMPERSLKSTNTIPPLFLCFCTHPMTVTFCPSLAMETSVHLWVLFKPCIDSAIYLPPTLISADFYKFLQTGGSHLPPAVPSGTFCFCSCGR